MPYIQNMTVYGWRGKEEISINFSPTTNVIIGSNGSGKSLVLNMLNAALTGDSAMLNDGRFERVQTTISNGKGVVCKLSIVKKNNAANGAPKDPKSVSAWRIERDPPDAEAPISRCIYLPTSRRYFSNNVFAKAPPRKGDPLEISVGDALYAQYKEYLGDVTAKYADGVFNGVVEGVNALFSKSEGQTGANLPGSPESAYLRLSSFLDRCGMIEPIMSLPSFKSALENDAGIKRVVDSIHSTEKTLDGLTGKLETLNEAANAMLGALYSIDISLDGMRLESKQGEPMDWMNLSAGHKNALIMLFAALNVRGGVLLVDDVDVTLHDDLQKDLTKNMRALNPDGQFILTTHSMQVVDYAEGAIVEL